MIRNILLASAATFAMVGGAAAADMPAYPAEAAAVVEAPVENTWSGMYVGIHGGWNWNETGEDGFFGETESDGFVIGGQAGYNWQMNNIVFGLEFDGSYVDNSDDVADPDGDGVALGFGIEQNYLVSARGRLGFAFDRFLVYGTGGAAFTGLDFEFADGGEDDANYFGWVAGGGVEFALTQNVTLGVEYLHYEFGDETIGDDDLGLGDIDLTNDVVRGRLNVKFDSLFGN
ncbi:outer membrane protein [Terrihabitans rhizophilus]|uniref:Outer membrane protein n=1 Tax=Terrihabitans rhizophilus TaxID=3092662 RepID=A0ABU4RP47_9HYPH|nr:outer membrane protein [Terrihabitans sp. PJ23]MDX6806594.1 outer membrane protein [Terrihabitans sp. PJ23]